jgi:hypothetical protein
MDRHCQEFALILNTLDRVEAKRNLSLIADWFEPAILRAQRNVGAGSYFHSFCDVFCFHHRMLFQ